MRAEGGRAATGREGEDAAARYLEAQGCRVLARNWRANPGEIDIVAECPPGPGEREPTLAFVEVRTRHGEPGLAEESITPRKAASMAAAAYAYMLAHDIDPEATPWRIDLVAVAVRGTRVLDLNWAAGVV
ncbi:MAG TPA: YraN family protein [Chloroflexia bacterium]|nr:YraN family protein [Chloroflexia bacterium]